MSKFTARASTNYVKISTTLNHVATVLPTIATTHEPSSKLRRSLLILFLQTFEWKPKYTKPNNVVL